MNPIPVSEWESQGNIWPTTHAWRHMLRPEVLRSDVWEAMLSKTQHEKEQAPTTNLTKLNGNTLGTGSLVEQGSYYTDEQRREAAALYASKGVMSAVSRDTGIPESTLCEWKNKSAWWDTALGEARSEIGERILAQNLQIVEKANERVTDSLENGDEKLVW
ncbi:MAG: transposase, partial [Proteobacteria bacterium]|nr:transposase [Pseudomonadota bacterium]